MKKTHKKIFGLFGLVLVIAVTVFAAFLPGPETRAATDQTVDNLSLRVVGATPAIDVSGIIPGSEVIVGSQEFNIAYENIDTLNVKVRYTDADGKTYEQKIIDNAPINYIADVSNININFLTGEYSYTYQYLDPVTGEIKTGSGSGRLTNYGYGDYVLSVSGEGAEGARAEKNIDFKLLPLTASATQDGSKVSVDLNYDKNEETSNIDKIEINIYDENGNPVGPSPAIIIPPSDNFTFDLSDYGLPSGTYTISVQAYDKGGVALYKPYFIYINYQAGEEPVPNTGGMMGDLNISKTDYIITGLIIFSIVGISGAVFISRHDKKDR